MPRDKVRLRFKAKLPLHMEHALVHKYGFAIESRIHGTSVCLTRTRPAPHAKVKLLADEKKKELIQRMETIAAFYENPKAHVNSLRTRFHNLAQGLNLVESNFVKRYMDQEFPEQDNVIALPDLRQG